jgi:hypothetical protein
MTCEVGPLVTAAWSVLGVADGRDDLKHWRLPANILNKQPRTNDKEWSSSLGVGRGVNNPPPTVKKEVCYEIINRASDLDGFFG